jgi:hypothetical protein
MEKTAKILAIALICVSFGSAIFGSYMMGFGTGNKQGYDDGWIIGYKDGHQIGYYEGFNETFNLFLKALQSQFNTQLNENSKTTYNLWVAKQNSSGLFVLADEHNTITDIGERFERDRDGFGNASGMIKYISWGNATPSASLTQLTTEATTAGFTRAAGTVTDYHNGNDYGWNVTISIAVTDTINLDAVGCHWVITSDSDGNLYACGSITQTTCTNGDTVILKWTFTKDDN